MADNSWGDKLRQAIKSSEQTPGWIAGQAGIERSMMARFMDGASINLQTAESIGRVVGLDLLPMDILPKTRRKKG